MTVYTGICYSAVDVDVPWMCVYMYEYLFNLEYA